MGAVEIDMVMNLGAAMEGSWEYVTDDIASVVAATREAGAGQAIVKVILECAYLADAKRVAAACDAAVQAGADFVKTSTGFGPGGATVADVRAMRAAVGPGTGVKAAGGIRDLSSALAMLDAGASRIGTSAGLEIIAACDGCSPASSLG